MNLYILRHGLAVEYGTPGYKTDSERPLTPEGEKKTRKIAEGLLAMGVSPDKILTSPFVRARRTAEIVAEEFKVENRLEECDYLASGGDHGKLIDYINEHCGEAQDIMLVGHEPDLSHLISVLVAGRAGLGLTLKKGGLCKVVVESLRYGRCGSMEFLLTPRLMIDARQ